MSNIATPYAGNSVPPNQGAIFVPAQNPVNPAPPPVSLIVRKHADSRWRDDNAADWTDFVTGNLATEANRMVGWDLLDRDLIAIDANSLAIKYYPGDLNINMSIATNVKTGEVTMVGTDASNEIRYEPNLTGRFIKVKMATFDTMGLKNSFDLNPHLNYSQSSVSISERNRSIGDPRGLAFENNGRRAWITGMGSNNVVVMNVDGKRIKRIELPEGPTGIVMDESRDRVYVLCRFAGAITTLSKSERRRLNTVSYYDPTPQAIKEGRPLLYNTHLGSGLGQIACASCHVDGRTDRLAWDLGNPAGNMESRIDVNGKTWEFHPMKGPMKTQTLVDIIGSPSLHHRGDRSNLLDFAKAFSNLQGADSALSTENISKLEVFLDSIHFGPNPNRKKDNTFSTSVGMQGPYSKVFRFGDAVDGFVRMKNLNRNCMLCHIGQRGRGDIHGPSGLHVQQPAIAEPLGGFFDRIGFFWGSIDGSTSGFGFRPDSSQDSIMSIRENGFVSKIQNNIHAAFMSWEGPKPGIGGLSRDSHAGVGWQVMMNATSPNIDEINKMIMIADTGNVGLIAQGVLEGSRRGFFYTGGRWFQGDIIGDVRSVYNLKNTLSSKDYLLFTLVPRGSEYRLAIDADLDGLLDGIDDNVNSPASTTWIFCANELETCSFNGTAIVRYGNDEHYVYTVVTNQIECRNFVFGDPVENQSKHCDIANLDNRTPALRTGSIYCAKENEICKIPGGSATVRYGAVGHWNYLASVSTDSIPCNSSVFGDNPEAGANKICQIMNYNLLPKKANSDLEWIDCAKEGGVCALPPGIDITVRFGANGLYKTGQFNFSVGCNMSTFGDPMTGVENICQFPRKL
jgi:hypothetical protein